MPTSTNRLAQEKSPYLLQHAHNPVDWYPWGEEAFQKARSEDKPIFLSIGYTTCHWCHVMERESFESEAVAEVLNRSFVPIKVDREERPDVDRIYMAFVQATTGSGGWPMSVFLTPTLEPFFGGTYFPPDARYGRPGFRDLLVYLARKWNEDRPRIAQAGTETLNQLRQASEAGGEQGPAVGEETFDRVFNYFRRIHDRKLGGFGGAPKFPRPVVHNFLLRYYASAGNPEALEMVTHTLDEMAKGGMNDQAGGGFHRYSVDGHWFVPHFEKMLYDQAQLATSYLEAFQITGSPQHAETARDIFEYVLRDMRHPEGGFYSAEDADSVIDDAPAGTSGQPKGEGAFYIWKQSELQALLADSVPFCKAYGVKAEGNVDEDPHEEFRGKNILFRAQDVDFHQFAESRVRLLEARSKRTRPQLDDKVLTSWNGLMISAFALGARVLSDERYLEGARRAAKFVLRHLYNPAEATLLRRYRDGDAAIQGFLDDYAFFIQGLTDLYEASFEPYFLEVAIQLASQMIALFEDTKRGGFYSTAAGDPNLVIRMKDDYDGAEPSGNSVAVCVLLRLSQLTERAELKQSALRALEAFSGKLAEQGVAMPQMLVAAMGSRLAPHHIVLVGERDPAMLAMELTIRQRFLPFTSTVLIDSEETRALLLPHMPWIAAMSSRDGLATAYVCRNFACQLPVTSVDALAELLH
jgi:uncharacterized protein